MKVHKDISSGAEPLILQGVDRGPGRFGWGAGARFDVNVNPHLGGGGCGRATD